MKKIKLLLLGLVTIVFISGCSSRNNIESISVNELRTSLENKETFILEIMSDSCSACVSLKPKLEEVLKEYDIKIKQINTVNFSDSQISELTTLMNYDSTPTIIFIKDGEEESTSQRIIGNVSKDKLVAKFKAMGYIKEGE